jgi:hypothetical protein
MREWLLLTGVSHARTAVCMYVTLVDLVYHFFTCCLFTTHHPEQQAWHVLDSGITDRRGRWVG